MTPITTAKPVSSAASYHGWILESTEISNLGGSANSTETFLRVGGNSLDQQYRGILAFDTGSLPHNVVITGITLKVHLQGVTGTNPFTTHGNILIDAKKGYFGTSTALEIADFQATASKNAIGIITNTSSGGWYSTTLSPSSAAQYVNLAGITQLRLRFTKDDNDDLDDDYLKISSGNDTAAYTPILIITYYVP
jgi:hypothetical protein